MPMSNFGDMVPWFDMPLIGIRQDFGFGTTGKPRCGRPHLRWWESACISFKATKGSRAELCVVH